MRDAINTAIMALATYYDFRERRVPDWLTLGGTLFAAATLRFETVDSLVSANLGMFLGAGIILMARRLTMGGIGLGDAKFAVFLGVALGARVFLVSCIASAAIGLIFASIGIGLGRLQRKSRLPYVPFLTLGAVTAMKFGTSALAALSLSA